MFGTVEVLAIIMGQAGKGDVEKRKITLHKGVCQGPVFLPL